MGFATTVLGDVVDIAGLIEKYAGVCAKLSVGLGIWGQVLGKVISSSKPSPQDIIDATNKALADLTKSVNDQFSNMQDYVDHEILELQRELMNLDYQQYHTYFSNCIREVTEEKVNECMEDAERITGSDYQKFMQYITYINDNGWKPQTKDVKKMELQFESFRDFAQLRINQLLTLAGTYGDMDGDYAANQTKRYYSQLKEETSRYLSYAKFCAKKIYEMHNSADGFINDHEDCDRVEEQWEGK